MKIGSVVARHLAFIAVLASGVLAAAPSRAVAAFTVDINAGGSPMSLTQADFTCTQNGTLSSCSASGLSAGGLQFDLGFSVDTDPKLFASVDVLNTTGGTLQFTATFTATGVGTSGIPTTTSGGVSGGATDNGGDTTTTLAAPTGSAFYTALIDNVTHQTLYADPYAFGPNVVPKFDSANFPTLSYGPQSGAAIVNSAGIKLDFAITDQDSASMAGTFELKPIPEPGTALLLGVGLVLIARRERRR
ncbi:MAG TPA: PEP-CTERM sorting domain-containing protein [Myxococcota bacterium]|nr:PEP-CTERM sorting domain-containing protein [Myxococcota bacterium]